MFGSIQGVRRASRRLLATAGFVLAAVATLPSPVNAFAAVGATVTPNAHYFGLDSVSAAATQDFTLAPDTSERAVTVDSVTIAGANADQFQLFGSCPGVYPGGPDGSCTVTVHFTPTGTGPATAELRFLDDAANSPQVAVLTGGPIPAVAATTLAYTGATAGEFGDPVALSAVLAGPSGPLAGQTLAFTLDGHTASAVTDATGTATATLPSGSSAGTVLVTFAGNSQFSGSTATAAFAGRPDATALVVTSPIAATAGASGVPVAALLTDDAGAPIGGRSVLFTACPFRGGGSGNDEKEAHDAKAGAACVSASALTSSAGVATVHLALDPRRYVVTAAFAGTADYLASSAHVLLTVSRGREKDAGDSKEEAGGAGD